MSHQTYFVRQDDSNFLSRQPLLKKAMMVIYVALAPEVVLQEWDEMIFFYVGGKVDGEVAEGF